jgi:sodium-dependent dicarboxylate transporter 2/3/5
LIVFTLTALAWLLRSFVLDDLLPGINDTVISVTGALVLFVIPSGEKDKYIMNWGTAKKLPWGILLLFGGGLTIATGFKVTGLATWLGAKFVMFEGFPLFIILFLVIIIVNFFTEITSNVATASVLIPILASLASTMGVHPFGLMVGATLASSCAFMLPVATPANAISYSSGYLTMNDMFRTGIWMNLLSSIVLFLCVYYLLPLIWEIDLMLYPF